MAHWNCGIEVVCACAVSCSQEGYRLVEWSRARSRLLEDSAHCETGAAQRLRCKIVNPTEWRFLELAMQSNLRRLRAREGNDKAAAVGAECGVRREEQNRRQRAFACCLVDACGHSTDSATPTDAYSRPVPRPTARPATLPHEHSAGLHLRHPRTQTPGSVAFSCLHDLTLHHRPTALLCPSTYKTHSAFDSRGLQPLAPHAVSTAASNPHSRAFIFVFSGFVSREVRASIYCSRLAHLCVYVCSMASALATLTSPPNPLVRLPL